MIGRFHLLNDVYYKGIHSLQDRLFSGMGMFPSRAQEPFRKAQSSLELVHSTGVPTPFPISYSSSTACTTRMRHSAKTQILPQQEWSRPESWRAIEINPARSPRCWTGVNQISEDLEFGGLPEVGKEFVDKRGSLR